MCRGKVKNGPKCGLRNEPHDRALKCGAPERAWAVLSVKLRGSGPSLSRFERENAGLRNCQDASGWHSGRPLTRGAAKRFAFGLSRPWEAVNGLKLLFFWKMMVSGTAKNVKWWCSGPDFLVICENDMRRNENLGLKKGVSRAAHTQYAYIWKYPPPPPRAPLPQNQGVRETGSSCYNVHITWTKRATLVIYLMKQNECFILFYFIINQ